MRITSAAITIALLSTAALAQQPDAFDVCAQEKDPTARLACFDRADSARHAQRPAPAAHPSAAAPAGAAPTTAPAVSPAPAALDRDLGLDARTARKERAQRGEADQPAPTPTAFVATVVRVIPRSPVISAFELSNGQIWEESEAVKFSAEAQQTVSLRHGTLGSFFLKNAAGVSVRVHRVK